MGRVYAFLAAVLLVGATVAHADPLAPIANRDLVRAHHEKVAGAALIGVGSALALVGQIFFIVAALTPVTSNVTCGLGGCGPPPSLDPIEAFFGGVFVGVGGAVLLTGIPVYVVGGVHMRRAERSRPTLTLAPQLSAQGASLSARIRF
jgi:hypothetical protein